MISHKLKNWKTGKPKVQKPYILVVEDEEPLLLLIRYNLEKEGFEVKCVGDGAAAMDEVDKRIPDLIVLDWMLPEMTGIEVCSEIRANYYAYRQKPGKRQT